MLELKNIHIAFGKKECIKKGHFIANCGEITVIVGESGVGKSSLLYLIGMLSNQSCDYYFNNQLCDFNQKQKEQFRYENISFIMQNSILIDTISVEKNVELYLRDHKKDSLEYLKKVDLLDQKKAIPKNLSGGQKQRVAIACALAKDTPIILGDEITSSLDDDNKLMIMNILKQEAKKGKMIILVSHDEDIVDQCDRIYRLEHLELSLLKQSQTAIIYKECNHHSLKPFQTFSILFCSHFKNNVRKIMFSFIIMAMLFFSTSVYINGMHKINISQFSTKDTINTRLLVVNNNDRFYDQNKLGIAIREVHNYDPLDQDVIKKIDSISNITKTYDYYQFNHYMSNGMGYSNDMTIQVFRNGNEVKRHQPSQEDVLYDDDDNYPFTILPFYKEDGFDHEDGVYIDTNMSYYFNIEVGDTLKLEMNVPYAMYKTPITNKYKNTCYGFIGETVSYETKVRGIVESNSTSCFIYLSHQIMEDMIKKQVELYQNGQFKINQDAWKGYSTIEKLHPYAQVVYVNRLENVLVVENEIDRLSDDIFVYNEYQSIADLQSENQEIIDDTTKMMIVEIIIFILSMIMIACFYLKKYRNTYMMLRLHGYPASYKNRIYLLHYFYQILHIIFMASLVYLAGSLPLIKSNLTGENFYIILSSYPDIYIKFVNYALFSSKHLTVFLALLITSLLIVHLAMKIFYDKQDMITWIRGK